MATGNEKATASNIKAAFAKLLSDTRLARKLRDSMGFGDMRTTLPEIFNADKYADIPHRFRSKGLRTSYYGNSSISHSNAFASTSLIGGGVSEYLTVGFDVDSFNSSGGANDEVSVKGVFRGKKIEAKTKFNATGQGQLIPIIARLVSADEGSQSFAVFAHHYYNGYTGATKLTATVTANGAITAKAEKLQSVSFSEYCGTDSKNRLFNSAFEVHDKNGNSVEYLFKDTPDSKEPMVKVNVSANGAITADFGLSSFATNATSINGNYYTQVVKDGILYLTVNGRTIVSDMSEAGKFSVIEGGPVELKGVALRESPSATYYAYGITEGAPLLPLVENPKPKTVKTRGIGTVTSINGSGMLSTEGGIVFVAADGKKLSYYDEGLGFGVGGIVMPDEVERPQGNSSESGSGMELVMVFDEKVINASTYRDESTGDNLFTERWYDNA